MCSRPPDILGAPLRRQRCPMAGDKSQGSIILPVSGQSAIQGRSNAVKQVLSDKEKAAMAATIRGVNPPGPDVLWRWLLKHYLRRIAKMEWLKGKKKYIVMVVLFIIGGCEYSGLISLETADGIIAMLTAAGLIALGAGVTKGAAK